MTDSARLLVDEGARDYPDHSTIGLQIVTNKPRIGRVLRTTPTSGRIGEHLLEPISEPVGHRIAEHQDVMVGGVSSFRGGGAFMYSTGGSVGR